MATFIAVTSSNEARLRRPNVAREILAGYFFDGEVEALIQDADGEATLAVCGYEWPGAWKLAEGSDEPDWEEDSGDGFEQFLLEIAPYLAEPLVVQAVGAEACRFPLVACEWIVRPGARRIETNGFSGAVENERHAAPRESAALV